MAKKKEITEEVKAEGITFTEDELKEIENITAEVHEETSNGKGDENNE